MEIFNYHFGSGYFHSMCAVYTAASQWIYPQRIHKNQSVDKNACSQFGQTQHLFGSTACMLWMHDWFYHKITACCAPNAKPAFTVFYFYLRMNLFRKYGGQCLLFIRGPKFTCLFHLPNLFVQGNSEGWTLGRQPTFWILKQRPHCMTFCHVCDHTCATVPCHTRAYICPTDHAGRNRPTFQPWICGIAKIQGWTWDLLENVRGMSTTTVYSLLSMDLIVGFVLRQTSDHVRVLPTMGGAGWPHPSTYRRHPALTKKKCFF
jgi:hypothetical protein